ncbi:glycosyltransferase family 2 protein [Candidatus Kaiserbacteria bacterium]|nr:glycosyltransferase family 2 protein [Candidatus Kaiserbacteria bacterium]
MKKNPDISIIVSSWNAADIIGEALESIVATAGDLNFDVTVIDDASTDGRFSQVDAKFRNDPRFYFVQNEVNIAQAATVNMMLERTKAKYIVTLDTDARLMPGALQALYAFMETHPEAGVATANLRNPDGSAQLYYRRILTPAMYFFSTPMGRFIDKYFLGLRFMKWYHYDDLDVTRVSEFVQPPIACLILRRDAMGPYILDPLFPFFMCDVDLCKRMYDTGYKVYLVPDAKVIHLKTATVVKRGKTWIDNVLNRSYALYFKKHYPRLYPLMLVVMYADRFIRAAMLRTIGREPMR